MGIDTIVEIGPKRTLASLAKRINDKILVSNVEDLESLRRTEKFLKR